MSRADIQERARLLDQIDRLNALFGGRFHLDSKCGSCGGPLECDRDAICRACTDAMEIERLRTKLREIHQVASDPAFACDVMDQIERLRTKLREIHQLASDPAFACDAMDRVLVILRRDESSEEAGNCRDSCGSG